MSGTSGFGRAIGLAAAAVAPVIAAAVVGQTATLPALVPWYAELVKPWFTPPNGVFAPVWTLIYLVIATAFWRVLRTPSDAPGRRAAIVWFLVQMALNALWSVAFFGLRSPIAGVLVVGLLDVAIAVTIRRFAPLDRLAAALMVPYLAWCGFATALTTGVWWLNR